jgi:hypothetical protein
MNFRQPLNDFPGRYLPEGNQRYENGQYVDEYFKHYINLLALELGSI